MINVAMLTPFFTGELGGPYNVITEIVPFLEKHNFSTSVITTSYIEKIGKRRTEFYQQITPGFDIYRFHSSLKFRDYRISLSLLPYLLKNGKNVDIIHSHALRSYQEDMGTLISLTRKIPLIISTHGGISINWDYSDKIPKMISDISFGILKRKILKPHFIAVSKIEVSLIKKYGNVNEDHIHYIPLGVNTDVFKPVNSDDLKKKLNLENSDVLLYVGRIAKGKGVDKLIKALNKIVTKNPRVKLVIVGGDSGYLPIAKTLIQKFNLSKYVVFTGYISKNNLAKYYSLADIVIYPSRQEIFGLVLCEAMACGKPVIGSDIMGPSEINLDGKTGFTSNFQNIDKLSELILELLRDKELMNQMGKNGLKRVKENYTWEKTALSHINLYKKVLRLN